VSLLVSVLMGPFKPLFAQWQQIIVVASVLSMALGAFAALRQQNIKRLMAYSSIGNVGYILLGWRAAARRASRRGLLPGHLPGHDPGRVRHHPADEAPRRHGRRRRRPRRLGAQPADDGLRALLFMFSLAGIPPLAGFWGKLYIFMAAVEAKLYWPAVLGVLASVVASYYYLRIVKVMYFDEPARRSTARTSASTASWPSPPPSSWRSSRWARSRSASSPPPPPRACSRELRTRPAGRVAAGRAPERRQHHGRSGAPGRCRRAGRAPSCGRASRPGAGAAGAAPGPRPSAISTPRPFCGPTCTAARAAELGFVAALAVADIVPDGRAVRVKWPNDVLVDGGKVAGILLESAIAQTGVVQHVVAGIGINVGFAPQLPEMRYPGAALGGSVEAASRRSRRHLPGASPNGGATDLKPCAPIGWPRPVRWAPRLT
jgi:hypothetical protein